MNKTKGSPPAGTVFDAAWLSAPPDRALSLVLEAGLRGADLVAAWIAGGNAAAVAEVAAHDDAPSAARKAARRGLNVLKSRGVSIPERTRLVNVAPPVAEHYEAWFRPADAKGTSAFLLGARSGSGRYRLVDIILREGEGIISLAPMEMSRTQLRETFDTIETRFGHGPAPVPMAWARKRLLEARRENESSRTPIPLGLDRHADMLGRDAPDAGEKVIHPADDFQLARPSKSEALARSAKLHAEPELRGWLPAAPAMHAILEEIRAAEPSLEGADKDTVEKAVAAIIDRSTDTYFQAERRQRTAANMRDAAISIIARGETARAADLLVTADAACEKEEALPSHAIPFLRGFFEKAFGLATARAARDRAAAPADV